MAEVANGKLNPFDLDAGVPSVEGALRPKPKLSDRISKRVVWAVLIFVGLLVFIFLFALDSMDKPKSAPVTKETRTAPKQDKDTKPPSDLAGMPDATAGSAGVAGASIQEGGHTASLVQWPSFASASGVPASGVPGVGGRFVPSIGGGVPGGSGGLIPADTNGASRVDSRALTPEQMAAEQEKANRLSHISQAKSNGLSALGFEGSGSILGAGNPLDSIRDTLLKAGASTGGMSGQQGMSARQPAEGTEGEQDEKLAFLKGAEKDIRNYHPYIPQPALSRNEVKAGTFMRMSLEQGINSDLPGQVTARVTEDVYDSITGCRLLIPAMSKVVGKYDSKVALGQNRNLTMWNLMVFKDGSELNLAGMQTYDTSGMAGMDAEVDNHYLRLFGLTFGMSILTAGAQIMVPPPPPSPLAANGGVVAQPSFEQSLASALAQQYGQLGAKFLGRYMVVQPTLRNFAGERFTLMIPHTIVFEKIWRDRCPVFGRVD